MNPHHVQTLWLLCFSYCNSFSSVSFEMDSELAQIEAKTFTAIYIYSCLVFRRVFHSLPTMHFRVIILSHWPMEIQMRGSESGLAAASPARAKHVTNARASRVGKGLRYYWEREDGKCGEGILLR
jgi:hypothetical protein